MEELLHRHSTTQVTGIRVTQTAAKRNGYLHQGQGYRIKIVNKSAFVLDRFRETPANSGPEISLDFEKRQIIGDFNAIALEARRDKL